MSEAEKQVKQKHDDTSGRRNFLHTLFDGALAAVTGWITGAFPLLSRR